MLKAPILAPIPFARRKTTLVEGATFSLKKRYAYTSDETEPPSLACFESSFFHTMMLKVKMNEFATSSSFISSIFRFSNLVTLAPVQPEAQREVFTNPPSQQAR